MKVEVWGESPTIRGLRHAVEAATGAAVEAADGLGHWGGLINECTPPNSLGAFLHGNNDNNSDNGNANDNEL